MNENSSLRGGFVPKNQKFFNDSNIEQTLMDVTVDHTEKIPEDKGNLKTVNTQKFFNDSNIEQTLMDVTMHNQQQGMETPKNKANDVSQNEHNGLEVVSNPEGQKFSNVSIIEQTLMDITVNHTEEASENKADDVSQEEYNKLEFALNIERQKAEKMKQEYDSLCKRVVELEESERMANLKNAELTAELMRCMKNLDEADSLESELLLLKVKYNDVCAKLDGLK